MASLGRVLPVNVRAVADALPAGSLLLEYFSCRRHLVAAAISRRGLEAVKVLDVGREELRREVEAFRRQLEDAAAPCEQRARRIYQQWLGPCLAGRGDIEHLCIVPSGPLHYLPFGALIGPDGRFVVERMAVSYAPSASTLVYCLHRRPAKDDAAPAEALIVADPRPRADLDGLPQADAEGRQVHRLARPPRRILRGAEATEGAVVAALPTARCFHFAGHTHLPAGAAMRAALLCTEDLDHDGRLEVREIFGLHLRRCELAVLSACQTHLGRWGRGDEIVGLERSFLRAGVPTVVASLWKVRDATTQALMQEFYRNLWAEKRGKLASLRRAQLAMLSGKLTAEVAEATRALGAPVTATKGTEAPPPLRHPRHWAAFVLSGDWR